jgi:hypothetical protein
LNISNGNIIIAAVHDKFQRTVVAAAVKLAGAVGTVSVEQVSSSNTYCVKCICSGNSSEPAP